MKIQRSFLPGSKWLYVKLYCGPISSDEILIYDIFYIVNKFLKNKLISKWFFVRYADPDPHLRLRFLLSDVENVGAALQVINKRFSSLIGGMVWKVQIDTYNREIERYNQFFYDKVESIFSFDSFCILNILRSIGKNGESDNIRWMIGLKLADELLNDFDFDQNKKQELISVVSNSFKSEFGYTNKSELFKKKYRLNKKDIESVLNDDLQNEKFSQFIYKRSVNIKSLLREIDKENNKFNIVKERLVIDLIHMSLNRLFISKNRVHELILYDFLNVYYKGKISRLKTLKE